MANCITGEGCKPMTYWDKKDFRKTFQKGAFRRMYPREVSQYIVKELNENCYKVIWLKSVALKYVSRETLEQEAERNEQEWFDAEIEKIFPSKKEKVRESEEKMAESISRTKRIIWEYAMCNVWEYFVTLTLDAEKVDRYDLKSVYEKFRGMMLQINASVTNDDWGRQKKIEYVLIPEFHKNGAVHFHGLMRGFHKTDIRTNEHGHLEWRHWRDGFGFCNMQKIPFAKSSLVISAPALMSESLNFSTVARASATSDSEISRGMTATSPKTVLMRSPSTGRRSASALRMVSA